jgi:hypothetical protein
MPPNAITSSFRASSPDVLMLLAAALTYVIDTARHGFDLLLSVGAGTGLIYLLRWFWWRINAWSEISAMIGSVVVATAFFIANRNGAEIPSHLALVATVAITTVIWVAVTWLTPPTDRAVLHSFYPKCDPLAPAGKPSAAETGLSPQCRFAPQRNALGLGRRRSVCLLRALRHRQLPLRPNQHRALLVRPIPRQRLPADPHPAESLGPALRSPHRVSLRFAIKVPTK